VARLVPRPAGSLHFPGTTLLVPGSLGPSWISGSDPLWTGAVDVASGRLGPFMDSVELRPRVASPVGAFRGPPVPNPDLGSGDALATANGTPQIERRSIWTAQNAVRRPSSRGKDAASAPSTAPGMVGPVVPSPANRWSCTPGVTHLTAHAGHTFLADNARRSCPAETMAANRRAGGVRVGSGGD
jgi:hypothetical protein